jgi:uncharacterized glyoxalase superfamily protein PhnB
MAKSSETQPSSTSQVRGGAVPYIQVDGAMKAAEFYKRAFGAETVFAHPVDDKGRTMHVHVHINGSSVMLGDPFAEHGCAVEKPQGFHILLPVDNADAWFKRAVDAGAQGAMPPQDMFWGDRYAQVRDPFGVVWGLNQGKR